MNLFNLSTEILKLSTLPWLNKISYQHILRDLFILLPVRKIKASHYIIEQFLNLIYID